MDTMQIILLILGIVLFAAGFIVPEKKGKVSEEDRKLGESLIAELIENQLKEVKVKISDVLDETISYAMEKSERSMERITNEKIMAINEYSDTVLEAIHKNHEEVVFLYDMLNDKQKNLKDIAVAVGQKLKEVKETVEESVKSVEETAARAAEESARAVEESAARATEESVRTVEETATRAAEESIRTMKKSAQEAWESANAALQQVKDAEKRALRQVSVMEDDVPLRQTAAEEILPGQAVEEREDTGSGQNTGREDEISLQSWDSRETSPFTAVDPEDTLSSPFVQLQPKQVKEPAINDRKPESILPAADEKPREEKPRRKTAKKPVKPEPVAEELPEAKKVDISFANSGDDGKNNNEKILALHKAGKSNMAIARELGLGIGEVNLVIGLFKGV